MVIYGTSTTHRLEAFARARGLDLGIVKSPGNSAGLYFVVRREGVVLSRWVSLGWTRADAEAAIERLAAGVDPTPGASGYVWHA